MTEIECTGGYACAAHNHIEGCHTGEGDPYAVTGLYIGRLREALLELHSAGLAMVPHLPPIPANVSVRWDEAMGAADELLSGAPRDSQATSASSASEAARSLHSPETGDPR